MLTHIQQRQDNPQQNGIMDHREPGMCLVSNAEQQIMSCRHYSLPVRTVQNQHAKCAPRYRTDAAEDLRRQKGIGCV